MTHEFGQNCVGKNVILRRDKRLVINRSYETCTTF